MSYIDNHSDMLCNRRLSDTVKLLYSCCRKITMDDWRTVLEITMIMDTLYGKLVKTIIHEQLKVTEVCERWAHEIWSVSASHYNTTASRSQSFDEENFWQHVSETWIQGRDTENNMQSKQLKHICSSQQRKFITALSRQNYSNSIVGILLTDCLSAETETYENLLVKVHHVIRHKCCEMLTCAG